MLRGCRGDTKYGDETLALWEVTWHLLEVIGTAKRRKGWRRKAGYFHVFSLTTLAESL